MIPVLQMRKLRHGSHCNSSLQIQDSTQTLPSWNPSHSFCSLTATEKGPGVSLNFLVPGHLEVRPSATGLLMRQVAARLYGPRPHGDLVVTVVGWVSGQSPLLEPFSGKDTCYSDTWLLPTEVRPPD